MKTIIFMVLWMLLQTAEAGVGNECQTGPAWIRHICHRLHQVWREGDNELYVTGYAWHNRFIYDPNSIPNYNELAWGGGLGKGFYDEDGDWHALSAFVFLDSHRHWEPNAGYGFIKMLHLNENTRVGIGYSVFVTQRPDIYNGTPFPGALPWVMFNYRRLALMATYIPGAGETGKGNVLFALVKWTL